MATIAELCTLPLSYLKINKCPVYHLYNPIEIFLVTLYFFKTAKIKTHKYYIAIAAIIWPAIAILNCLYFQPIDAVNSYFILLECFVIIFMGLFTLYKIFVDDTITNIIAYPHFWIWVSLLIYSTATFFFWTYLPIMIKNAKITHNFYYIDMLEIFQAIVNIFSYSVIGFAFFIKQHKNAK